MSDTQDIAAALAEPFDPSEVKFKPAVVSGNRAMAMAYVDARVIQDRLDHVCGVDGWQDEYEVLANGSVVCRLRIRFGEEWIIKMDVGSPSEQPDDGDKMKAAFSDALKRAAVKFGISRYLYRLPAQWVDYDPKKRQFLKTPTLPAIGQPGKKAATAVQPQQPAKVQEPGFSHEELILATDKALNQADLFWKAALELALKHPKPDHPHFEIPKNWEEPLGDIELKDMTWVPVPVLQRIRASAAKKLLENQKAKKESANVA